MSNQRRNIPHFPIRAGLLTAFLAALTPTAALAGPTITFGDQGFVTFSYEAQIWTQYRGYTSATNDASYYDTFLRRSRLVFGGQYNDYVGFYASLETTNDNKLGNADKALYYRDAYVTIDYTDGVRFIGGRFKNAFSRENLEACFEPLTIDRAEVIAYTPFGANGGGSRDDGWAMWGNLANGKFQYRVMVADGRQGDEVAKSTPRLTARVHWSLLDPETDYGYLGTYLGTRKVLTFGLAYDYQADVAFANFPARTDSVDYKAWTADVFYEYPTKTGTYTFSSAYFNYDTQNAVNANPDPDFPVTAQLKAYYVKGGYLLPRKVGIGRLQPYFRFEKSDYGVNTGLFDQTWKGAGFNYYFDGQNLKLTFEFAKIEFDKQDPTNASLRDYNQATAGFQLIF
ncbi:MAG TPA: selenite/tellurite reduction operon porin ExtI [Candidatus Methylomirabilis sp.]|nr:selenite/tellurite reduction operon porin ExtI [Candidatus Methylomirabilis sp.]